MRGSISARRIEMMNDTCWIENGNPVNYLPV